MASIFMLTYLMGLLNLSLACYPGDLKKYNGRLSTTKSGKTCQRWDIDTPHKRWDIYKPSMFPENSFAHNYCRHTNDEHAVWCYTTDPNTRWEFCDVPVCDVCYPGNIKHYDGTLSKTRTGRTCQRWDSETPHKKWYWYKPSMFPENSFAHNYCRYTNDEHAVWCYTTDPNKRWEFCDISTCENECYSGDIKHYDGKISTTKSGKTCQRWDSDTPHKKWYWYKPSFFPENSFAHNYCRYTNDEHKIWCYTTDPKTKWEDCDISICDSKNSARAGRNHHEPLLCEGGSMKCSSVEKCVPSSKVCDGRNDCGDNSDESGCPDFGPCGYEMLCKNDQRCLPFSKMCDGKNDCGDNSDEYGCEVLHPCGYGSLRCVSVNKCVPYSKQCDGRDDCGDSTDEYACPATSRNHHEPLLCGVESMKCSSVEKCVPHSMVCDGRNDCGDNSDESYCQDLGPCGFDMMCKNDQRCLPFSKMCDGRDDCGDNSDEYGCEVLGPCGYGSLKCVSVDKCVPYSKQCDGQDDCGDNSDEFACQDYQISQAPQISSYHRQFSSPHHFSSSHHLSPPGQSSSYRQTSPSYRSRANSHVYARHNHITRMLAAIQNKVARTRARVAPPEPYTARRNRFFQQEH